MEKINNQEKFKKITQKIELQNKFLKKEIEDFILKYNALYLLSYAIKTPQTSELPIITFLYNLSVKKGSNNKKTPTLRKLKHLLKITEKYCSNVIDLNQLSSNSPQLKLAKTEYIKNLTNPEIYPLQVFEKINEIFSCIQEDFFKQFKFHPIHIGFISGAISTLYDRAQKIKTSFLLNTVTFSFFKPKKPFLFTKQDILKYIDSMRGELGKEGRYCNAGVDEYLNLISTSFGENQNYNSLYDEDISKTKPLLKIGDKYFCCNFPKLFYLLPYQFEQLILSQNNKCKELKDKYIQSKNKYSEDLPYNKLKTLFGEHFVFKNIFYTDKGTKYEIDILVRYDNKIIVCEIKSGKLRNSALAGNQDKLEQDLKKIFKKSFSQIEKTKQYIFENSKCTFYNKKKEKILTITNKECTDLEFFSIGIHVENLMRLSNNINSSKLNYYNKPYFWAVNILELDIILNHIKYPSLFIHYIKSRLKAQHKGIIQATDELSLFGFFLQNPSGGFDFQKSSKVILESDFIKPFDEFYLQQTNNFPEIKIDNRIEKFIKEREKLTLSKQSIYHTEVIHTLLMLNSSYLKNFLDSIDQCVKKTKADGLEHNAFVSLDIDKSGIGFVSHTDTEEGMKKAKFLAEKNKYKYKLEKIIYLFKNANDDFFITNYWYLKYPFKQNKLADKNLTQYEKIYHAPKIFKPILNKDGTITNVPFDPENN